MKIKNIALFLGGYSNERNISIKSSFEIFKTLFILGYNVYPIDIKYFSLNFFLKKKIDKVFISLHGRIGEDGCIQGLLEYLNIPYTGSNVFTSSLCINKYNTKIFLSNYNINIIPDFLLNKKNLNIYKNNFYENIFSKIGFPLLLKPNYCGSSIGINIIYNINNFKKNILKYIKKFNNILIEKYIFGTECTVGIVDGKVLCPIKINLSNNYFSYNIKYINKKYFIDKLDKKIEFKIKNISIKIWNILNCKGCIRIDYIIDKNNNIWFLELNTIPGMTKNSLLPIAAKFSGINYINLIEKILYSN